MLDEFNELPNILTYFPLIYTNGAMWESLSVFCVKCNMEVKNVKANVDKIIKNIDYRTSNITGYNVKTFALCDKCDNLTVGEYILNDDMSLVRCEGFGKYKKFESDKSKKRSMFEKIKELFV